MPEIYYAIEFGYEIIWIHQVWDYPDRLIGLFKHYIDTFLEVKQESSDWLAWCTTEDLKKQYIENYKEKEGIELNFDAIKKNPAVHAGSKSELNNAWGYFSQDPNKAEMEILRASCFYELLMTYSFKVTAR